LEELKALHRFIIVYRLIVAHNKKYDLGLVDYQLAINQFADLTANQVQSFTEGFQEPPFELGGVKARNIVTVNTTMFPPGPKSIDWNALGHVTPPKDQG
jgi:hypothetical protein